MFIKVKYKNVKHINLGCLRLTQRHVFKTTKSMPFPSCKYYITFKEEYTNTDFHLVDTVSISILSNNTHVKKNKNKKT